MPQGVAYEVHRTQVPRMRRHIERLSDACRQAFARAAWKIEFHGLVDPVDPLVVPRLTALAQPVEALPEAPAIVPCDHFVEPIDGLIPGAPVGSRTIPGGAADLHRLAGKFYEVPLFFNEPAGGFAPLDWHFPRY